MGRRPAPLSAARQHTITHLLVALMLVLGLAVGAGFGQATRAAAQVPGGTNLTLTPSTTSPNVEQIVSFDYRASPPAVAPPFASISSLKLDFGDGTTADLTGSFAAGQVVTGSTTHGYANAGSYQAVLTATASNGGTGRATASLTVGAGPVPGAPVTVNFQPGWNLIANPPGSSAMGPGPWPMPYTYRAGDTAYVGVQNNQSGVGYWQFQDNPWSLSIPSGSPSSVTIPLPVGQWIMVGNPGSRPATVKGADAVYIYDQVKGYQQTTTLQPGQGAWVYSTNGGTLTISS